MVCSAGRPEGEGLLQADEERCQGGAEPLSRATCGCELTRVSTWWSGSTEAGAGMAGESTQLGREAGPERG